MDALVRDAGHPAAVILETDRHLIAASARQFRAARQNYFPALQDRRNFAGLETGVQKLNDIDVDALNEAIQNLNDSVEPCANFFNRYR